MMAKRRPIMVTVEYEDDEATYYTSQRWDRNHLEDVIVNFEDQTVKVVLKNGDISVTDFKEILNHGKFESERTSIRGSRESE